MVTIMYTLSLCSFSHSLVDLRASLAASLWGYPVHVHQCIIEALTMHIKYLNLTRLSLTLTIHSSSNAWECLKQKDELSDPYVLMV